MALLERISAHVGPGVGVAVPAFGVVRAGWNDRCDRKGSPRCGDDPSATLPICFIGPWEKQPT